MYKNSFHLQGWETEQIAPPLSHRLQLQPLQQIITKAKGNSPKNDTKKLPLFTSTKIIDKEKLFFHTRSISRTKIKTEPQKRQLKVLQQPTRLLIEQMCSSEINQKLFKKTQQSPPFFKSIITFIEKQPTAIKKSPRFALENKKQQQIYFSKSKKHSKSLNILLKKQPIKTKERFQTISKFKANFQNDDLGTKYAICQKDQSIARLKKFFLQTIQGIESQKQNNLQKNNELKLKSMLQKSNRKKKQIQQLFKTRLIVGQNIQQRRIKNKLHKFWMQPQEKIRNKSRNRLFGHQFDDQGLFCPWTYKDEKIINYMRSKNDQ